MHRRTVTWLMPLRGLALSRVATGDFGDPIPIRGWSPDELQCFTDGRAASEEVEEAADGLGPVLNGTSCAGCHNVGAIGGCSEVVETRFGGGVAGTFDSLPEHFDPLSEDGGSLIQTDGIALSDRRVPATSSARWFRPRRRSLPRADHAAVRLGAHGRSR